MSNIPTPIKRTKQVEREYVSPKEAQQLTSVSQYTWRRYALEGRIASTKIGWRVLIPVSEVRRVMAEGYRPAQELP